MATAREILQLIITGDGKQAVAEMKRVGATAQTELGTAQRSAATMGAAMMRSGAVVAAGGAAVVYGLKQASDAYVQAGRETLKLQRLTGGTAEDMSRLRYVAQATGVGVDTLSTAVIRLSKSSQGSAGKGALGELGVDLTDAQGNARPMVDVLSDLATKFESLPNGIEKNAYALKLFGRGGAELLPLLNRGGEGIDALAAKADALGLTLNQSDLDDVKAYVQAQRDLAASFQALQVQVGKNVFPVFSEVLQTTTDTVSGLAEAFSDLPDPLKRTVGGMTAIAGVGAIAGGSVLFFAGATAKASAALTAADGTANRFGTTAKGLGVVLAGLAAIQIGDSIRAGLAGETERLSQAEKQLTVALGQGNTEDILKAFSERAGADTAGTIQNIKEVFGKNLKILPDMANETIESIERAFESLSIDDQAAVIQALKDYGAGLESGSQAAADNAGLIDNLTGRYNLNSDAAAAAADETGSLAGAQAGMGDAAGAATSRLAAMNYQLERTGDAAEGSLPGLQQYAKDVADSVNPFLDLADANARLEEAERNAAEVASMSSKDIVDAQKNVTSARRSLDDATRNLADAQAELNDVLNDDPMFGLKSVSPEEEIADARNRLAEANRRLAANPGDALALTMRDTAVLDLEDASKRAQDEKRNAEQRADDIKSARERVADAERGVQDATSGLSDAQKAYNDTLGEHGTKSQEYADAAREVIRAQMDVEQQTANLAQFLVDNGITSVDAMNTQLDRWVALGGPVGAAAQQIKDSIQPLVGQAITLSAAISGAISAYDVLIGRALLFGAVAGGAAGSAAATGAGRIAAGSLGSQGGRVPVDQFGIPLYGRPPGSALGGLIRGPGTGTSDSILAMLSNGEYVIPAHIVDRYGVDYFDRLKKGSKMGFASGGLVGRHVIPTSQQAAGGRREGDLNLGGVAIQVVARNDELAGAAVIQSLRNVARRSGRGLRATERMVG